MKRTRFVAVIALALGSMPILPGAVWANGGSFFDFDRTYYVPGEVVTVQTTFSTEVEQSGSIDDGPYHAFLLSSERWIQPPNVPDDAIPVGRIEITDLGGKVPVARIRFTVPNIRPGRYTLTLCNLPCTHASLGDLAGGSFSIVPTKEIALRRELSDRFDVRLAEVRQNLAGRIKEAEKSIEGVASGSEVEVLAKRVSELEKDLARMLEQQSRPASRGQMVPWIVGGIVTAFAGFLLVRRRRRRGPATRPVGTMNGSIPMTSDSSGFDGQEDPSVEDSSRRKLDPANV